MSKKKRLWKVYEWLKILIRLFHNCIDIKKKGYCNKNLAHNSGDKPLPWTVQRTKPHTHTHTDKPQTQRHGGKHIHQKHAHANTYSCHVFLNNYTHASNTHNHRGGTFPQCTCRKNASLPHEIQTSLLIQSAGQTNTRTHARKNQPLGSKFHFISHAGEERAEESIHAVSSCAEGGFAAIETDVGAAAKCWSNSIHTHARTEDGWHSFSSLKMWFQSSY